jgi:hypothetical protein
MTEETKRWTPSARHDIGDLVGGESTTTQNGVLQLLADQYALRLLRIRARMAAKIAKGDWLIKHDPAPYYTKAEAAVRALYADAT